MSTIRVEGANKRLTFGNKQIVYNNDFIATHVTFESPQVILNGTDSSDITYSRSYAVNFQEVNRLDVRLTYNVTSTTGSTNIEKYIWMQASNDGGATWFNVLTADAWLTIQYLLNADTSNDGNNKSIIQTVALITGYTATDGLIRFATQTKGTSGSSSSTNKDQKITVTDGTISGWYEEIVY